VNNMENNGLFGQYGGTYVSEILIVAIEELIKFYNFFSKQKDFQEELQYYLTNYAGRPTPLYYAKRLTKYLGGAKIYLKREDLLHTGAHKINNTLGQILLAKKMNKKRVIAETGAGQHGVATATACALLGLKCTIYMGEIDVQRQKSNVMKMQLLGAEVIAVKSGSRTLKDAINEALRDWVANVSNTFYCIGSTVGPHPYPTIVKNFQSIIGKEVKNQILQLENKLPDYIIACVGGGSNAMGIFDEFLKDKEVNLIGVEAGGLGIESGKTSATLSVGRPGVLHGAYSYLLQDDNGQVMETHSVSAGLDYPGVGPQHSFLKDSKRVNYTYIKDNDALEAFKILTKQEGIIPALESSHALSYAIKIAPTLDKNTIIIVNLSGRGDKDLNIVEEYL